MTKKNEAGPRVIEVMEWAQRSLDMGATAYPNEGITVARDRTWKWFNMADATAPNRFEPHHPGKPNDGPVYEQSVLETLQHLVS